VLLLQPEHVLHVAEPVPDVHGARGPVPGQDARASGGRGRGLTVLVDTVILASGFRPSGEARYRQSLPETKRHTALPRTRTIDRVAPARMKKTSSMNSGRYSSRL